MRFGSDVQQHGKLKSYFIRRYGGICDRHVLETRTRDHKRRLQISEICRLKASSWVAALGSGEWMQHAQHPWHQQHQHRRLNLPSLACWGSVKIFELFQPADCQSFSLG